MKFEFKKAIRPPLRRLSISIMAFSSLFVIADLRFSVAFGSDSIESPGTTRGKISEGMQFYSEGKFAEAAEQFAAAAKKSKERSAENAVALFDQACALRAAGEIEKARELLLEVATSKDQKLASLAHYNLAAISAEEGRKSLGDDPLSVSDSKEREKSLERFNAAVSHYRDSLQSDSNNEDARHNLELLRLYAKELEQSWRDRDMQAQRDKQDLFQFLSSLDKQQSQLREQSRQLANRQPRASRLERTKLAELQRKVLEELGPLSAKVDQSLQPPQAQAGQSGSQPQPADLSDEEKAAIQQIRQLIGEVTQKAQDSISSAAELIGSGKFDEATRHQQDTCDRFYETYALMAPFQQVLQRAIDDQQALIERSTSIIEESSQGKREDDASTKTIDTDWSSLSWRQNWLSKLNNAMTSKAAGVLKQLPPADNNEDRVKLNSGSDEENDGNQSRTEDPETNIPDTGNIPDSSPSEVPRSEESSEPTAEELMTALRRAIEKALENSPSIAEHSKSASSHLKNSRATAAKPEQEEVLRLLKEIADLLPKQPPQDQQQDNQDNQNQDKNEQKQDEQKKNQDQQQQDKSQDSKSDQQQSDKQESKNKQDKSDPKQSPQEQPKPYEKDKEGSSQSDKDKKKEDDKEKEQSEQQKQSDEKKQDESKQAQSKEAQQESASENSAKPDDKAQKQKIAQERAQVILRRIREREATYRELLEQLRDAQGRRSPVEKDW
jgi:hypothetical protein